MSESVESGGEACTVAYLILSHQNPGQVLRLVERLLRSDPAGHVVIEHDATKGVFDLGDHIDHPRVHLLTSFSQRRWGNFSLVEDVLRAMSWTLEHLSIGWIAVLSGQDYPLRSLESFGSELRDSGFDAFLSARPIPLRRRADSASAARYAHARYFYRWYQLPRWLLGWARGWPADRLISAVQRRLSFAQPLVFLWSLPRGAGDMIGFRRVRLPFGDDFQCYLGSQWMTISRVAAVHLMEEERRRPEVVRLYRRSMIPDESLIHTILCNDPQIRVSGFNHHYVRMIGPGQSHAAVLTVDDLGELRDSGRPFARKFDERVDHDVMDQLDAGQSISASSSDRGRR